MKKKPVYGMFWAFINKKPRLQFNYQYKVKRQFDLKLLIGLMRCIEDQIEKQAFKGVGK